MRKKDMKFMMMYWDCALIFAVFLLKICGKMDGTHKFRIEIALIIIQNAQKKRHEIRDGKASKIAALLY